MRAHAAGDLAEGSVDLDRLVVRDLVTEVVSHKNTASETWAAH